MTGLPHLAFAVQLLLLVAGHGGKTDSREEVARAFFAAAKYQEAIEVYSQLFAQYVQPDYIYNIGRCYQNMGDADMALKSFKEFARKAKHMDASLRKELDGHIKEMEALKAQRAALSSKLETGADESSVQGARPESGGTEGAAKRKPSAPSVGSGAKSDNAATVDAFLARLRAAPEEAWASRAVEVDEDKLAKTAAMVSSANPSDPRLAEYQLHLATQYAGKHFALRLQELRAGREGASDSHKVATGERKLGPEISSTFTTAADYYLAASKHKGFAKLDETLMGLAVLLQANNMEPRARSILLQLLRTFPDSKQSESIRQAAGERGR